MNYYLHALKNYFNIKGRARRREFWTFVGVNTFVELCLVFISVLFVETAIVYFLNVLLVIFLVVNLMPSIAITVRRLQDTSRTGWWILLILLPFLGIIVLLIFMLEDSSPAYNQYGEYPKFVYFE